MAAWAAVLVSGLLYSLLFPPVAWGFLSWLAIAPLALALGRGGIAMSGARAALFAWVGTAGVIVWIVPTLHDHFERGWLFSVGFWLLFSATALAPFYAPLLGAQAWASRRLPRAWAPLLFAAAWTGAEWTRTQFGFRSPWARLGDAHFAADTLRQGADLFGVYGLSFVTAFVNGALAEAVRCAWRLRRGDAVSWRPTLVGGAVAATLVAGSLLYGAARLRELREPDAGFEVAIVQGNLEPEHRWRRSRAGHVLRRYGGLTRDLLRAPGARPPDLVIWPENAIQTRVDDPVYGPPLVRLAAHTPLLIGAPRSEADNGRTRVFNSAFLVSAEGVLEHYDKRRLLPFSETRPLGGAASFGARGDLDAAQYTAGAVPALFDVGSERLAPLICMEVLYPALAREAALAGATALVNLSNDGWFKGRGGREQHFAMAIFRAVETRLPLVRSTTTGISAVVGPDGSLVAALGERQSGVLRAAVPTGAGQTTLYTRWGDAFAIGCALFTAGATLVAARRGAHHARAASEVSRPPRTSA